MVVFLGLLAIVVSSASATFFATRTEASVTGGAAAPWLLVATPLLVTTLIAFANARLRDELRERLRRSNLDLTKGFFLAVALYAGAFTFSRLVCGNGNPNAIWLVSLYAQVGDPKVLHQHAFAIPLGIFFIAALEELVWRGVVTVLLEEKIGSRFAWIVSALLYTIVQLPSMWTLRVTSLNPLLVIAALGIGLLLGGVAKKTGRLVQGIVAHGLFIWAIIDNFPLWQIPR